MAKSQERVGRKSSGRGESRVCSRRLASLNGLFSRLFRSRMYFQTFRRLNQRMKSNRISKKHTPLTCCNTNRVGQRVVFLCKSNDVIWLVVTWYRHRSSVELLVTWLFSVYEAIFFVFMQLFPIMGS